MLFAVCGFVLNKDTYIDLNTSISDVADIIIPKTIQYKHVNLPTVYAVENRFFQIFKSIFENTVIHRKPNIMQIKKKVCPSDVYL